MLYYIQEIDSPYRIKIGFSEKPLERIATLSAMPPQEVQILKITEGERIDERWLHERWREYRVEGKREWYYPASELLDEIDAVNTKV